MTSKEARRPAARRKPWEPETALDKPEPLRDPSYFSHSVLSPLRYPGAKRQLTDVIESIVVANVPPPRLLVEPFCGGATSSLRLAGTGKADHVVLADVNPLVAAFWYVAAFDTTWLINRMHEEEVTVARWDFWRACEPKSRRDRALKCLFLNRTTFSGILHGNAGAIGGRSQKSDYRIDCRFGKPGLERRLRAVGELADTGRLLDVWECDWQTTLSRMRTQFGHLEPAEIAVYLDPPYVDKGPRLYDWSFDNAEHAALASALRVSDGFRWILSYDDNEVIRGLYEPCNGQTRLLVSHTYTASGHNKRTTRDELLVTNYAEIPDSARYRSLDDK